MTQWSEAARKYDSKREAPARNEEAKVKAAAALDAFIQSAKGKEAIDLLRASNKYVRFGEEDQSGNTVCWLLHAQGLVTSSQLGGSAAVYTQEKRAPVLRPATSRDIVDAWAGEHHRPVEDIVTWLIAELDKIAAAAP